MAALLESHPLHERTRPWTRAVVNGEVEAHISWPTLLEIWSALVEYQDDPGAADPETQDPGGTDPGTAAAAVIVEKLLDQFEPVEISGAVYRRALRRCAAGELDGSETLSDALHLMTAEVEGVDGFVTFRAQRFESIRAESSPRILTPPDPPFLCL